MLPSKFEIVQQVNQVNAAEIDKRIPVVKAEKIFSVSNPVEDKNAFPVDSVHNLGETIIVMFKSGNRYLTERKAHSYIREWSYIVSN